MTSQRVILLVEDNLQDERLTLRALEKHNIKNRVVVCRDGAEALDWLFGRGAYADRDLTEVPQLILLDLKLPKLDGLETLREIRRDPRTKRLPVVVLTTSSQESDIMKSYDVGANGYVRKPVGFDEFTEAIKNLGLYWLLVNEISVTS